MQFQQLSGMSLTPVWKHFGSWAGLRTAAGLPAGPGLRAAGGKDERRGFILAEARRLFEVHGEGLTLERFCREANVASTSVRRHFGSWPALRRAAGMRRPRAHTEYVWTERAVLEEYERVTRQLGWCPGLREFAHHARCSSGSVKNRFGGIRNLETAYRAWLQERARQSGADARWARGMLERIELWSPRGELSRE